jgi:hypothetical protein
MASIEGHYRGPLVPEDAQSIVDHLRAGAPASEVLRDKMPTIGVPAVGSDEGRAG